LRDFFPVFFRLAHFALQNVNKDYVIFLYFHNFVAKSDQKPKAKNGMIKPFEEIVFCNCWYPFFTELNHCGGALFGQWLLDGILY